jgi:hypothetical protein
MVSIMSYKTRALGVLTLAVPMGAFAQIAPNNNYAQMLSKTNSMLQLSISQTIASQASTRAQSHSSGAPMCDPLPPIDLQRGVDGHVPPELQGDPRYQAWLRCRQGQGASQTPAAAASGTSRSGPNGSATARASAGNYPTPVVPAHLPITATDFRPAVNGHPFIEQYLGAQPFTPQQRAAVRQAFAEMSARVAGASRPNNLAVSMAAAVCGAIYVIDKRFNDADSDRYLLAINDRLGASPQFSGMSSLQKQNLSDSLLLQTTVLRLLVQLGETDPQARSQSTQLAHTLLQQLTGSPVGRLSF